MNHVALARKYRPKKFIEVVGQSIATTILTNIISSNKLHHAYLLTGTRGVGKTTIARIIAKALNCGNISSKEIGEPCCQCNSCLLIDKGSLIDVIEIDAASNTGVENIREIIENSQYAPTDSNYKVYIIDEVHMLSKSAFNAMLKTLEEPPAHVIFILATTELHKIPITILSRCLQIKLRNLSLGEIALHLGDILNKENIPHDSNALELIAKFAHGSMRDALSILDEAIAFGNGNISFDNLNKMLGNTDTTIINALIETIINYDGKTLVSLCQKIYQEGYDLELCLENILNTWQDISIHQITGISTPNQAINHMAEKIGVNTVQLYYEISSLGMKQIKQVEDKYSTFLMTMLRMLSFNIGNNQQKTLVINNHPTTKTNPSNTITATNYSTISNIEPELPLPPKNQQPVTTKQNPAKPTINFNGDWIALVKALNQYLSHSAPFLNNSELEKFSENVFYIKIDQKYQSSFNEHTLNELNSSLQKHFATKEVTLSHTFYENLTNTSKEFDLKQQQHLHEQAVTSIKNDPKLINIIEAFSATILPDSVNTLETIKT